MRLFGLEITRQKAITPIVDTRGGWTVYESYPGAWQQNVEVRYDSVLSFHAIFACITLIAGDIAKLRLKLVEQSKPGGIWTETTNPAYSPVLRKPNNIQTRIQFWENWIISKLTRGNTYALKSRDGRRVVTDLWILDPTRVTVLMSETSEVFYELQADNVAGLRDKSIMVPASEIIHDRFNCLYHPLVGLSPLFASGLAATQGLNIQRDSAVFFGNKSRPGAILIAPKRISPENAAELRDYWNTNYGGDNRGKIAVLGDDMKYQAVTTSPEDAQLVEQLKWSAEVVCSTFHVPPYKIGVGTMPAYNNIQALNVDYYSTCLQALIEAAELCLDEGLATGEGLGTEFDVEGLLRMDGLTQIQTLRESIAAAVLTPNEARAKLDLGPKPGGDSLYMQQQNFSTEALAKRDAKDDPFAAAKAEPAADAPAPDASNDNAAEAEAARAIVAAMKGFTDV